MSDQFKRISQDLQSIGLRVEALREPETLAGAQADLERRQHVLEDQISALAHEVRELPAKFEKSLDNALRRFVAKASV